MNEERERSLRQQELAFFGRIGASVSHDMRNVLSIIGQCAGLLEDMLALAKSKKGLDYEKLKSPLARITRHVGKGTETMERFSRFAHAADEGVVSSDLTAISETVAALAERHVVLAGCKLQTDLPPEAIHTKANPFSIQCALFSALDLILQSSEKGGLVTIRLAKQGPTAVISISGGTAAGVELSSRLSQLSAAMSELQGKVDASAVDGKPSLILSFPIE